MAYELIETIEVGSGGAASIEFTSIPQDGVDLLCVISGRCSTADTDRAFRMQLNGDTTLVTSRKVLEGDGSSASSIGNDVTGYIYLATLVADNATTNTFSNIAVTISNYTSTNTKSISVDNVGENNATTAKQAIVAAAFPNSTGITSVKVFPAPTSDFVQYSTASLYKIY